ncbi:MAG TPA: nucleotide exchange factor GrpE [Candidatus Pelethocola excrementipullorum]|nr:nucleotide exchange factor GrpE [Candidatus Pelethocola excrementipullorum]
MENTEKDIAEDLTEEIRKEADAAEAEKIVGSSAEDDTETSTVESTVDEETAEEAEPVKETKKFFKKKKDKKDEKIEELTDRLQRQMAEFDNFRKRTDKEKSSMYAIGARDVVEKILPVVDNFERGLAAAPDLEEPFADGMNKIYKQLTTVLEDLGVTAIEAVGKEFDPNLHNAVMHVEDDEVDENIIVEEFQKGYLYKDTVVRHSMVKVAN